jgi:diaminopropionate ammonia-lyase
MAQDRDTRARFGLCASSRVLCFGSEGNTDPALYEQLVNGPNE